MAPSLRPQNALMRSHESQRRLSIERIEAAVMSIDPVFLDTPQFESESLSAALGVRAVLKVETGDGVGALVLDETPRPPGLDHRARASRRDGDDPCRRRSPLHHRGDPVAQRAVAQGKQEDVEGPPESQKLEADRPGAFDRLDVETVDDQPRATLFRDPPRFGPGFITGSRPGRLSRRRWRT